MIQVTLPFAASMRLNDGGCDPAGRLWFGSMATDGQLRRASLYTLGIDYSLTRTLAPVSISNGLGWSPDGRTMYYVDTPTRRVDVFPFDPEAGALGRRRTLATIPSSDGKPDGLTVDADGNVWVALWGGAAVQRLTPAGRPTGRIELPTRNVTSCCFGGPGFEVLYITTARRGLSAQQLAAEPTAGSLFACRPGARGLPAHPFGG
jgi:sugar lactone lactonase YvrE